ncbi:MAG: TaqI-like C-terminal specificity domain-containing protein [Acidobacteriota bacterium]|jgi:type I restriction-modification system DNA methylase subunit|nr:TaqI-like C-terminal specificity domain-containing protein [Acidobacteriota bacterium]
MKPPDGVKKLVETFADNLDAYKRVSYKETQVRREFIDPFFEALGWDVANRRGYAESYKDVIHEDAIKVGGVTKAPDYCFRIGGKRMFFLEAKKPSVDISGDIHPAFQLRRYAWSAKLPLSILTDFEEFAVYDCRVRPEKSDKVSHSRILYLTFRDYLQRWDEIAAIFSREAVLKGSFDRFVASASAKKGTTEVDAAFLQEIERWRDMLARNIALRNSSLSQRELNFAVQRTIDRIVFLRICEDRGMEKYGELMALREGGNVYDRLFKLFDRADEKYNSGMFYFKLEKGREYCDDLTPILKVDDKPLKDIFKNIYYPESPYEFSVLPADILGRVYEKFLGKVIRLTAGHQARVEDKPEVRKAGGVYYTPTYIVDYIVKSTVGRLVAEKKPGPRGGVSHLRILDPACGSGSFLIGAYQFLLDWHRDQYVEDGPENWATGKSPRLYQSQGGEWRLTTDERKRILLNNIFGVDIDPQAVEVTKLSLLLKVLEGENEQSIGKQMDLFRERVLPDLSDNIKCGNSLIGPDFYRHRQAGLFSEEEAFRINAFDWQKEFAGIMQAGGFDAVIGNPPYVRQEGLGEYKSYFQEKYKVYHGIADLYAYFIEKGISLLKTGGYFSYIVANKWLRANYGSPLRGWLKKRQIVQIVDFGDLPVFKQATTYPCVLVARSQSAGADFRAVSVDTLDFVDLEEYVKNNAFDVPVSALNDNGWALVEPASQALLDKLSNQGVPLSEYVDGKIYRGILTGLNEAFVIDANTRQKLIEADPQSDAVIKPFLFGRDIKRYQPLKTEKYLILFPKGFTQSRVSVNNKPWDWMQNNYPAIAAHLEPHREKAEKRCDKGDYWWELRACDYYDEFEIPKIMLPDISLRGNFTLDEEGGKYCVNTAYIISNPEKYLLGVLNSKLIDYYYRLISSSYRGGYLRYIYQYMEGIPIRRTRNSDSGDMNRHNRMVGLVEQMLELNQQLATARTPQARDVLQRHIEVTDKEIDHLVYELYDLTEAEIALVENAT